jgi:hypothetical protein
MENFKVGDRVVCVDNKSSIFRNVPPLILGRNYIVYGVEACTTCSVQHIDVGLTGSKSGICRCKNVMQQKDNIHWCGSWRFRKVAEKVEYIAVAVNVEIEEPVLN